jgi:hypothetical protein
MMLPQIDVESTTAAFIPEYSEERVHGDTNSVWHSLSADGVPAIRIRLDSPGASLFAYLSSKATSTAVHQQTESVWSLGTGYAQSNLHRLLQDIQNLAAKVDPSAREQFVVAVRDAIEFIGRLPHDLPLPRVSATSDGEIIFRWSAGQHRAVAGFEGDGAYGYALLRDGQFEPGEGEGATERAVPRDLLEYLRA